MDIYTNPRDAYSECPHVFKSASDRARKPSDIAYRLYLNHPIQLRATLVPAHSGIWRRKEWAHNEPRAVLRRPSALIVPIIRNGPHFASSKAEDIRTTGHHGKSRVFQAVPNDAVCNR